MCCVFLLSEGVRFEAVVETKHTTNNSSSRRRGRRACAKNNNKRSRPKSALWRRHAAPREAQAAGVGGDGGARVVAQHGRVGREHGERGDALDLVFVWCLCVWWWGLRRGGHGHRIEAAAAAGSDRLGCTPQTRRQQTTTSKQNRTCSLRLSTERSASSWNGTASHGIESKYVCAARA